MVTVNHVIFFSGENGRKFRHPKRFMATPSPLIAIEWWRVSICKRI